MTSLARVGALGLLSLLFSGCLETGYVLQAGEGQLDLVCRARSIDSVVESESTDPELRAMLSEVPRIKRFAISYGLVPTSSYEDFVALDRPVAVWVVSAAPPLSFDSLTWSFPIVGSVPYLGWFDKIDAQNHAASLAEKGWDVDLRGASAYSTLGWFKDPVLSSMLGEGPGAAGDLAEVILHESLHATVYVKGQAGFNEGLATFVGDHLAVEYLRDRFGADSEDLRAYIEAGVEGERRTERLRKAFTDLDGLYKSKISRDEKLRHKSDYLAALRAELHMKRPVTNATLAGFRAYHGGSKSIEALFHACGDDMKTLIRASKTVRESDFPGPQAKTFDGVVEKIIARGCPKH